MTTNVHKIGGQQAQRLVVICGATASRKSELAIGLAQALGGELICCDSVQMVRGFIIGSAAPSATDYEIAPHHLYQSVEWNEPPDAGRYQRLADEAIDGILQRGKVPIVVGGTGLYLRSLLFGLAAIPHVPGHVRAQLLAEHKAQGAEALFYRLQTLDPVAAGRISGGARNTQRVLRALEVVEHTGRALSSYWEDQPQGARYESTIFMPSFSTEELGARIAARVGKMMEAGFVAEVQTLLENGVDPQCRAMQSLGYREVLSHLEGGITEDQMISQIIRGHKRYAKRQKTWFKAMDTVHTLDANDSMLVESARVILESQ